MSTFKKEADYGKEHNYIAEGEITVTITLDEYRELVTCKATMDSRISKADADRYERNTENQRLKDENAALKAELYELKKKNEGKCDAGEPDAD